MAGEPWIRVHANLRDKPVTDRCAQACGVRIAEAAGLLVALWGAVSQHARNGAIRDVSDAQLERWAGWEGKRGTFAKFVREHHMDDAGRINEWDEYAGALEQRRASDRDRKRKSRGQPADSHMEVGRMSAGSHADSPRDSRVTSAPARANETIRYEDVVEEPRELANADDSPTAVELAIWSNQAVTDRWGEQPHPYTPASATETADALRALEINPELVRSSIARQCQDSKRAHPPRSPAYFRQGIEQHWDEEQARRAAAAALPASTATNGNGKPHRSSARASPTGRAALLLNEIKGLIGVHRQPGQAERRYIRRDDVAKLGAAELEAYDAVGGADRILSTPGEQWSFLIRDYAAALEATATGGRHEPTQA